MWQCIDVFNLWEQHSLKCLSGGCVVCHLVKECLIESFIALNRPAMSIIESTLELAAKSPAVVLHFGQWEHSMFTATVWIGLSQWRNSPASDSGSPDIVFFLRFSTYNTCFCLEQLWAQCCRIGCQDTECQSYYIAVFVVFLLILIYYFYPPDKFSMLCQCQVWQCEVNLFENR